MVDDSSRASGAAAPPADLTTPEARQQAGSGLAGTGYLTLVHVLPEPLRSQMLADPALSDPALSDEQRFTRMRQAVGREISAMAGAATAVCEPTPAVASIPDSERRGVWEDREEWAGGPSEAVRLRCLELALEHRAFSDAFLTVATARLFAAFVGGGEGRLRPTLAGPVKPAAAPALSDDERHERLKSLLEASRERRSAKPDADA